MEYTKGRDMGKLQLSKAEGWIKRLDTRRPLAVVLGASVNGLSFVRSLGRRGIPTLMLDSEPLVGTYSRYTRFMRHASLAEKPQDFVRLLESIGSWLDMPGVLLPTSDEHGLIISQQRQLLSRSFHFVVPDSETMENIVNKRRQYALAEASGVPIPKSHFPESIEEVKVIADGVSFPCILKPYKAHEGRKKISRKVAVVESREDLILQYEQVANGNVEFMIQEIIPGEDTNLFGYLAFWDAEGRERSWLTKRKLRQNPPHYGDGSLQETVDAPEVADLSRRLLKNFTYRGFVGIEFKFDSRDKTFRLMEINPRTVSGNQLAIAAGIDFPAIGYQYLTGLDVGALDSQKFHVGVRYIHEEWDIKSYLALRKSGRLTLGRWLASLRGVEAMAIGAWDDPLPALVTLWRFLRAAWRKVLLRLVPLGR